MKLIDPRSISEKPRPKDRSIAVFCYTTGFVHNIPTGIQRPVKRAKYNIGAWRVITFNTNIK